jgi:hypothetical protein
MCFGVAVSVFGHGANPVALDLSDGGAWLVSDPTGTLVHVNGPSGRADAAVAVPGAAGHDLAVAAAGEEVLVTDRDAGTVHRVEPARLAVVRSAAFDREVTIVAGGDDVYAVEPRAGRIRRLDPLQLSTVGTMITLPAGLGAAGQTRDGTLWVPVPAEGTVVPVRAGVPGAPVPVTPPGHRTAVTVVDDRPVVVDRTGRTVTPLTAGAAGRPVALPTPIAVRGDPRLLVPARADGELLPLVEPAGRLVLVDLRAGAAREIGVPTAGGGTGGNGARGGNGDGGAASRRLGAPASHAGHVYVPDSDAGMVWDFDPAGRRFAAPVPVGPAGGPARITVTIQDGQLWINDATGANAVLIMDRTRRTIVKRAANLPGASDGTPRPLPPAPTSVPADGALTGVAAQPDQPGRTDRPDDQGRSGEQPSRIPGHRVGDLPPRDGRPKPGRRPTATATQPPPTVVPTSPVETPTAQPTTAPPVPTDSPGDG